MTAKTIADYIKSNNVSAKSVISENGKADIAFACNNMMKTLSGHIGYDGIFYALQPSSRDEDQYLKAFSIKNGIKATESDLKIKHNNFFSRIIFLKNYIVACDGTCYDYDGDLCERETTHHKNVEFINGMIYTLSNFSKEIYYYEMRLEIKATDMIYEVDVDIVENLIAPSLKSVDALNKKAYSDFLEIKKLIVYAGLSRNFEKALLNIKEMNNFKIFGGSSRGFASKRLLESLRILKKRTSQSEFRSLLNNDVELRKRIAKIHGTKVVEITVSEEDFNALVNENRVSNEIKKSKLWQSVQPDMLVVFTNNKNEHLCARTHKQGGTIIHNV